jgi:hypothetical protein
MEFWQDKALPSVIAAFGGSGSIPGKYMAGEANN